MHVYLRGVLLTRKYLKKNKKQTLVFLRAPKHFNIGKRKVFSFKNTYSYKFNLQLKLHYINFYKHKINIIYFLNKLTALSPKFNINSIKINFLIKIKFTW